MSQNVSKIHQKARLDYIEENIIFLTQEELATELNVSRKTIQRDIDKWKQKGGYQRFLTKEFFELYGKEKRENPSKALDRILYLMGKHEEEAPQRVKKRATIGTLLHKYRTIIEEEETITTVTEPYSS